MGVKRIAALFIVCCLALSGLCAKAVDFLDADELFEVMDEQSFASPLVIEFWASWCPGSRVVAPRFGEVAREFGKRAQFFKIDIEENPEVVNYFNINMLPCVLAIFIGEDDDGEPQVQWTGARGEPYLQTHHIREIVKEALAAHQ